MKNEMWREQANCRGEDINIFFLELGETTPQLKKALAICNACKVKQDCLDYALDNSIKTGIYGGMSPKQRFKYKKVRKYV